MQDRRLFYFAARTSKRDIEWPKGEDGLPELVYADGIKYHYSKLAILEYAVDGGLKVISDCRDFFNPLINLAPVTPSEPETNMTTLVSWGTVQYAKVEFPALLLPADQPPSAGTIHGTGSTYRQRVNLNFPFNWFHFPLTISYPFDIQKKMRLQKLFVLFDSKPNAKIDQIDIYKGKSKMKTFGPLNVSGNHSDSIDDSNTFTSDEEIVIDQGLGISLRVSFTGDGDAGEINYRSVGAQFRID